MERLIIDKTRLKHQILNNYVSFDEEISSTELKLEETLEDGKANLHSMLESSVKNKMILDLKYELNDDQALVYELKFNNFSNKEIGRLLDIDIKNVDNILRTIKIKLKKYVSKNNKNML